MFAEWVIWYADGSSYSNLDIAPEMVPGSGVIAIRNRDPEVGNFLVRPSDAYCFHLADNQWFGHDMFGLTLCLAKPGWRKIAFGETVANDLYRDITTRSAHDPRLPRKSAYRQHEFRQDWMVLP